MPSTLARLFRLAKATKAQALENFTTEALAAAIRSEPGPFLRALHDLGLLVDEAAGPITVQTQVKVRGGILDLVIEHGPLAARRSLWIEVKVYAEESGDQLDRYLADIAAEPPERQPVLLVLGRHRLRPEILWLSWQAFRRAVLSSGTTNPWWADFQLYLKEVNMADDHDEPVRKTETLALRSAHHLLGKTARILALYAPKARVVWPSLVWPEQEEAIRKLLGQSFQQPNGTFTISVGRGSILGVTAGMYPDGKDGEALLGLRIWARPKAIKVREQILRLVANFEAPWETRPSEWPLIGAYRDATEALTHEEAASWLCARLEQLRRAGLLSIVENPAYEVPTVQGAGEDDEDDPDEVSGG